MRRSVISAVALLASSVSSLAATVQNVAGPVSLNNGGGFRAISSGAPAAAGDMVMAGAGGSAQIVYDNGCVETVDAGTTVNVKAALTCDGAAAFGGTSSLVVGGLAVAGVVGGVIAISSSGGGGSGGDGGGGGGNPASP